MTIRHASPRPTTPPPTRRHTPLRRLTAAVGRAYRRPHPRLTRDRRWIIARLVCYPLMAAAGAVAIAGACDPSVFHDLFVDGARVRVVE